MFSYMYSYIYESLLLSFIRSEIEIMYVVYSEYDYANPYDWFRFTYSILVCSNWNYSTIGLTVAMSIVGRKE